jgi:tRNA(Ile)-lysidine synthase
VSLTPDTVSASRHGRSIQIKQQPASAFQLSLHRSLAQLDMIKVKFPITWRRWQAGDSFRPFGMGHSKKISDFLIDLKVPLPDKDTVTVLESGGEIIWVVDFRIDDRYKVTQKTSEVLIIEVNAV